MLELKALAKTIGMYDRQVIEDVFSNNFSSTCVISRHRRRRSTMRMAVSRSW